MKKTVITVSFVIAFGLLSAQNKTTKKADKLFASSEYVDAAKAYLKLVDNNNADAYVYKQLGDSYYHIFNPKEAIIWYGKAIEQEQDAELYYRYAQMLKATGNYTDADKQMDKFAAMKPKDSRAVTYKKNKNYLAALERQAELFSIAKLDVNSDKSDFGAILTADNELYFSSARNTSRKNYGVNKEPFLDVYKAIYNENGTLSEATLVSELNTKWHDGPVAITSDGNTIYFGSESFNESDFVKDKENRLKKGTMYLYKATKEDGDWKNKKLLPFSSEEYSVRNPSISKDGKVLYFSSNMPGGFGGEDLWRVRIDGDTYGEPENLGAKINTSANESFPFIADNNVLYYSSDSPKGYGGLDVYRIDLSTNGTIENLGTPINSAKDDFAFSFNTAKKQAFFSSNRDGVDDIYSAIPICNVTAMVVVKDAKTGAIIEGADVVALNNKEQTVGTQTTGANGTSFAKLACDTNYSFQAGKQGYESGVSAMEASEGGKEEVVIILEPIVPIITEKEVILAPIFFEFDKSNITAQGASELDKLVVVMEEHPNMIIFVKSHTDTQGGARYNKQLSDKRAKATVQYVVSKGIAKERISGEGFGEEEPKVNCTKCTAEEHAQNRRSEFLIVKK